MFHRHSRFSSQCVLIPILAIGFARAALAADYRVHIVDPVITNHMILPDGPLPSVCKEASTIKMAACRGEYEPASFVVTATTPLEAVRIEVGQLSGPGGSWPRKAVDVRVVKTYYRPTFAGQKATIPTLLVRDESFLDIEPAPTPEEPKRMKNVVRGAFRDTPELQPVRINRRKQFWVTVHVPETAKPGTYKTTLRIVPQKEDPAELTLQVQVHPFDLLESMLEHSLYYPGYLSGAQKEFNQVTPEQMRVELANMKAHGLNNPNVYSGTSLPHLEKILRIRESVGMRPKTLYLVHKPLRIHFVDRPLTPKERQETHNNVRQANAWAKERGYDEVFFMAQDELRGERLSRERDSIIAVDEAGGKVFVAVVADRFFTDTVHDFFDRVGDVLHRPVMGAARIGLRIHRFVKENYSADESLIPHMAELGRAGTFEGLLADRRIRKPIDGVHRLGRKIFTYASPVAGTPLPELRRRNDGLGLWRIGFDGVMTWAYVHISQVDGQRAPDSRADQVAQYAMVLRTDGGVLDTLHWEACREAVDDVRYLTTLYAALAGAAGRFPHEPIIADTHAWLAKLDVFNDDLDAIRHEMARRTIALLDLGYKEPTPEEVLAEVDLDRVDVMTLSEPWRFKLDGEDQGVKQKWFDPALDDGEWGTMPTDETGWGEDLGVGWYRTHLPQTKRDASKRFKYLFFGACDEEAWVYLNGQQIFEHSQQTTGRPISQLWLMPFVVPLHDIALHGRDLLAVRVHNTEYMGGIWKPVHLVRSADPMTENQLHALFKMRRLRP